MKHINIFVLLLAILILTACTDPMKKLPYDWPMPPMTDSQVSEAKKCDIEALASKRYPDLHSPEELFAAYKSKNACDWATLAYACADNADGDVNICLNAFSETVGRNPAFIFRNQIFYHYFSIGSVVLAPPISQKTVSALHVDYAWGGMGDPVAYTINITQADSTPVVKIDPPIMHNASPEEIKKEVQALPQSLTDLLPIKSPLTLFVCTDSLPSWRVTLTFTDGSVQELTNNKSNMIQAGGPWQTIIEGQNYVQFSSGFILALDELIQSLGLEYGQPEGMFCSPNDDVLGLAYP